MDVFLGALIGLGVGVGGSVLVFLAVFSGSRRNRTTARALTELASTLGLPLVVLGANRRIISAAPQVAALGVDLSSGAARTVESVASDALRTGAVAELHSNLGVAGSQQDDPFVVRAVPLDGQFVVAVIEDRRESHRLDSVRTDFLVNISHEIKTPVAAIGLLTEALVAAADDPAAVRNFTGSLAQEVLRLTRMSRDVIELGRIEAGVVDVARDPFPISDLVREAVAENASAARAKRITVVVDADDDAVVRVDRRMVTTALSNLVENAIQYSRSDTTVQVSIEKFDDRVAVLVADEGVGIHVENIDRVFERFYREDLSRSREGSGLGLSIVKHTAGVHQGTVSVSSRLGIGSTFRFEIPAAQTSHE